MQADEAPVITWGGGQQRVRCPDCRIIIGGVQPAVTCKRCGSVFVRIDGIYLRERE